MPPTDTGSVVGGQYVLFVTPPAGPGQESVLETHYAKAGQDAVAFIDETYHIEMDGRSRFYTMAAVVIAPGDLDDLREELDEIVPSGWWHTSEQLRTARGYGDARALIRTLQAPYDACVIVDHLAVADDDKDGLQARREVLRSLLVALDDPEGGLYNPVRLAVIEENRVARVNNFDRGTRDKLLKEGLLTAEMGLVHASPGSEHLLWLPDVVCSAYRQKKLRRDDELFDQIREITHVTRLTESVGE